MESPEQQAEEILIQEGFADPENLEPEIAELLREAVLEGKRACQQLLNRLKEEDDEPIDLRMNFRRVRQRQREEVAQLLERYEWIRRAMFDDNG